MNCKPGDLAIIIKPPLAGRLVEVMYSAPGRRFVLPDGYWHATPSTPDQWVIRSLGSPFDARMRPTGRERKAMYAAIADKYLRPLPGDTEQETQEKCEQL